MKAYARLMTGLFFAALPATAQEYKTEQTSSVSYCDRVSAYGAPVLEKAARGYALG